MQKTQPYHHGDLARALIEAGVQRLRQEGPDRLSLRRIANDVGVSPAAAYHHFSGKEAVLTAIAMESERCFAAALRGARDAVSEASHDVLRDRFAAIGQAYLQFARDEPELLMLVFNPANVEACIAPDRGSAAIFRSCIDDLARAGRLRVEADRAATLAWSSVHGFADLSLAGVLPDQAGRDLITTVLDALLIAS